MTAQNQSESLPRPKKVYKRNYGFANNDRYRLFLKQQILRLDPRYYVMLAHKKIATTDGPMYAVTISPQVEIPAEPIVECWINNELIYLWKDRVWTIGVLENGIPAIIYNNSITTTPTNSEKPVVCHKTLVIHEIGTETI